MSAWPQDTTGRHAPRCKETGTHGTATATATAALSPAAGGTPTTTAAAGATSVTGTHSGVDLMAAAMPSALSLSSTDMSLLLGTFLDATGSASAWVPRAVQPVFRQPSSPRTLGHPTYWSWLQPEVEQAATVHHRPAVGPARRWHYRNKPAVDTKARPGSSTGAVRSSGNTAGSAASPPTSSPSQLPGRAGASAVAAGGAPPSSLQELLLRPDGPQVLAAHVQSYLEAVAASLAAAGEMDERQAAARVQRAGVEGGSAAKPPPQQPPSLQYPTNIVETLVGRRLEAVVSSQAKRLLGFFMRRAVLGCVAVALAKSAIKSLLRHRRLRAVRKPVCYVLDEFLPTAFWGPMLGSWEGVLELTGRAPWGPRRAAQRAAASAAADAGRGAGVGSAFWRLHLKGPVLPALLPKSKPKRSPQPAT